MTKEEKKKLVEAIMKDASEVVKRRLNEAYKNKKDNFIQFVLNLEEITSEEIKAVEKDICNTVRFMKLNEDVTDDALDYILSGKSKFGSDVKYKEVLETFDDLFENPNKNFREIMMGWYAYCSGEIGKLYHFREWQMITGVTTDSVPFIDFLVPESVSENLISDLRSLGLVERNKHETLNAYIQREYRELVPKAESLAGKFDGWVYLRFAPISQKNVREIIRNNSQYIYHITDVTNIESIKKTGILLDNRSHPEVQPRVFLLVPNRNDIINRPNVTQKYEGSLFNFNMCLYRALPLRLYQYRLNDGTIREKDPYKWQYSVIKIDIDKIPENVEFYWDIHSFPFAFFTKDAIPASAIIECSRENIRRR